jgi:hypothetical protein
MAELKNSIELLDFGKKEQETYVFRFPAQCMIIINDSILVFLISLNQYFLVS